VGVSKTNASLFATGVYVKIISTGLFLLFGIDKIGRRNSLLAGAAWMAVMMFILGAVLATHPPNVKDVNHVSSASIAMVVMIYLYVIGYSASWGPVSVFLSMQAGSN
jgi:MFS family permease